MELDSSSVPLLQEKTGLGAALGRHSISARPFLGARTLFTGFRSNVGAQAAERRDADHSSSTAASNRPPPLPE